MNRSVSLLLSLLLLAACAPRAHPLSGAPAPARLPDTELRNAYQLVNFRWDYDDNTIVARGDGVARIAPPDSVRLDLFLDGGYGGGHAFLIADEVTAPGGDAVQSMLPPPALLWAAMGRLHLPSAPDTVARVDADTLRADIGRDPTWRVVFVRDSLVSVSRIHDGRVREWVSRVGSVIRYADEDADRHLTLTITRAQDVSPFASDVWP